MDRFHRGRPAKAMMSVVPTFGVQDGARSPARPMAGPRATPFEFVLFGLAVAGMALGGAAIALGLLRAPTATMVVGDWYLLTSGFVIVAAAGSNRRAILLSAGAAALLAAALYPPCKAMAPAIELKFYVKASVAFASASAIATQFAIGLARGGLMRANRDLAIGCFAVALVITPLMSGWGIQISALVPQTLDVHALRMDEAFGARIPAAVTAIVESSGALSYIVFHVYISISLAMVGYDLIFGDTRDWRMTKLLLVSSFLGFLAYFVAPVVGTVYFEDYSLHAPLHDIAARTSAAASDLPRNAMPSLHSTWGFMLIVSAVLVPRQTGWRRIVPALFVLYGILTICGALAYGDHYLIDCVVALPFAATLVLSLARAQAGAVAGYGASYWTGVVLFAGWIAMLRIGGGLLDASLVLAMTAASLAQMAATVSVLRAQAPAPRWT